MMRYLMSFVFLLFLFVPSVVAYQNYSVVGGDDYDFGTGVGWFNSALDNTCGGVDISCSTKSIDNLFDQFAHYFPSLVADLDGDGISEIIMLDDSNIRLYHGSLLTIVDAVSVGGSPDAPFMLAYDIDDDGYVEIIFSDTKGGGAEGTAIYEYNGTLFYEQADLGSICPGNDYGATYAMQCKGAEECVQFCHEGWTTDGVSNYNAWAVGFNSTDDYDVALLVHYADNNNFVCPPDVPVISVADYDNDGRDEYVYTMLHYSTTGANGVWLFAVNSTDRNVSLELSAHYTDVYNTNAGATCSNELIGRYFTSPLVFDIDGSASNGLEVAIGMMISTDDYKIYTKSSDGTDLDDYPELSDGEGLLISNVMRANAFPDGESDRDDFCVMGYDAEGAAPIAPRMILLCGSEQNTEVGAESVQLDFQLNEPGVSFNVTSGYPTMVHMGQHSTVLTDGTNLDEVVLSYGVFILDYSGVNDLDLIFENPHGEATAQVVPVDVEGVGRNDLLVTTATNIWYIDDGFTNTPGRISYVYIDPCVDNTWKKNTSVEVRMIVTDDEGDSVNASAVLYWGTSFNQTGAWTSGAEGTTFSFMFKANESVGAGTLRLMGADVENPAVIDIQDYTFSVGDVGIEWGQGCITEETFVEEEDDAFPVAPAANATAKAELRNLLSGEGMVQPYLQPLMAMIFTMLVGVGIALVLAQNGIRDGMVLLYLPLGCMFVMWTFFAWLGMLPGWTVVVGLVFACAIIGWKVYNVHGSPG